MALELYVMPLQLYFQGDFAPSDAKRVSMNPQESCDEKTARERSQTLQRELSAASGEDVSWPDEGELVLSRSIESRQLHALRSFAAHLEYPPRARIFGGRFKVLDDPRNHKGLRKIYDGSPTQYEHLMRHSDDRGFYFPVDFPSPCPSSEPKWWMIGSAPRLRDELTRLEGKFDKDTPALISDTCTLLIEIASVAHERQLPMIWQGS